MGVGETCYVYRGRLGPPIVGRRQVRGRFEVWSELVEFLIQELVEERR